MIGKVLCRSEAGVAVFTDVRPTFCVTRQVQLRQNNIKTWLTAGADPGLGKGGGDNGAHMEREPITVVWGWSPKRGPGQSPW